MFVPKGRSMTRGQAGYSVPSGSHASDHLPLVQRSMQASRHRTSDVTVDLIVGAGYSRSAADSCTVWRQYSLVQSRVFELSDACDPLDRVRSRLRIAGAARWSMGTPPIRVSTVHLRAGV